MHERFPYGLRNWYPHLKPADAQIWTDYINAHPDAYDSVMYDVAVGQGAKIPEGTPDNIARDFKILTQYKIDVVAFSGGRVDIIELKPNAGSGSIGQALVYRALYRRDVDPNANPRAVVITDILRPDMAEVAAKMGVILLTP